MNSLDLSGVALVATLVCTPLAGRLLRRLSVLDVPNERSSHQTPTVRGAGVAPAAACGVCLVLARVTLQPWWGGLLTVAVGFALIGAMEDIRGLRISVRLILQVTVAATSLAWLLHGLRLSTTLVVLLGLVACFWIVGFVNAFNFMDGINGISAAQVIVAGVTWLAAAAIRHTTPVAVLAAISAAAAAGFLPYNFPTARVFLGDAGSYFFGGWLAVTVIVGLRTDVPPEAMIAPLMLYLLDTGMTVVLRARRGDAWYLPHREHVYQRLTQAGRSHAEVALGVATCQAACGALGLVSTGSDVVARVTADVAIGMLLVLYALSPRLARRSGDSRDVI